tara:strand:- start:235 stop:705 length:471 start_codon:yes stop_codon:yes gene_type:complete
MSYIPQSPSTYQGNQVLINSDRLVFNAKNDSILLFSDKAIGFSTNGSFHFDTSKNDDSSFIVNSPNIYLGLRFNNSLAEQPAVLGDKLEEILKEILDLIDDFTDVVENKISYTTTVAGTPTGLNPLNFTALTGTRFKIKTIKNDIISIKSKKVKLA